MDAAAAAVAAAVVAADADADAVDAVDADADADAELVLSADAADAAVLGASPGVDASLGAKRDRSRLIRASFQAGCDIVDPALRCVLMKSTRLCNVMSAHDDCAERPSEDIRAAAGSRETPDPIKFVALAMLPWRTSFVC